MTDYKNLKLIASSSPHIRKREDTTSIMLDVIIALVPAMIFAAVNFGWRAILNVALSAAFCAGWEYLYRLLLKKPQSVKDLSAVVTGILLAFVSPADLPWWMLLIGSFFAIVVVKQLYGGIGCNFLNPALGGRAVLVASYAGAMTSWMPSLLNADATTGATPMALLSAGDLAGAMGSYSLGDMFIGKIPGSLGEVSAIALLCGGIYLMIRRVISWHIPVAYIGTVALLTYFCPRGNSPMEWMLYNVLGGGLILGAFFMAPAYSTSPVTNKGKLIFGLGCGLITVFIRYFGSYPEGVSFAILFMNIVNPYIKAWTKFKVFGVGGAQ